MPRLLGRSYPDAVRGLNQFTVEAIDTPSASPVGVVIAQDPGAGALAAAGSVISLQVSDGSLIKAETTVTAAAPVTATAAPAPVPASKLTPASATAPPPLQEAGSASAGRSQSPTWIAAGGVLIFVVGVSLGLLFGASSMRQRLLSREPVTIVNVGSMPSPPLPQPQPVVQPWVDAQTVDQHPVEDGPPGEQVAEAGADSNSATDAAPEIQFIAWLVPVQTTIELVARADEVSSEQSSDHYA